MSHKSRSAKKSNYRKNDSSSSEEFIESRTSCNSGCRQNNCPNPNLNTAMCQKDCDPLLKLTTSTNISSAATFTALSPDGTKALSLISFFLGDISATPIDFQLFENDCGVLTPIKIRVASDATNYSTQPSSVSLAVVSTDFKLAAGLYEYINPDTGEFLGFGFVDVFDPSNPSINKFSFPVQVNTPSGRYVPFSLNTDYLGGISVDNRYLTLTYQTGNAPDSAGVIQVYDLHTGNLVAEAPINGNSNGSLLFDLCQSKKCDCKKEHKQKPKCTRRRFVAVGTVPADISGEGKTCSGAVFSSPSLFMIFELKSNKLFEVDRVSTSSQVTTMSVPRGLCCPPEILIAITTAGVIPGEPSLYTFTDPVRDSLNGKPGGVTVFRFNGEKLNEVAFQPIELGGVSSVGFTPNGKYLAIAFGTNVRAPYRYCNLSDVPDLPTPYSTNNPPQVRFQFTGFFQLFRVLNKDDCSVCLYPLDIPRPTGPAVITFPFSTDGRWLLVTSAAITRPSVPQLNGVPLTPIPLVGPINNIQLYQIVLPECCPYTDQQECINQNSCDSKKACKKDRC